MRKNIFVGKPFGLFRKGAIGRALRRVGKMSFLN